MNQMIRSHVIQILRNRNTLNKIGKTPIGDWEQIISPNTMNEPIVMYGSNNAHGRLNCYKRILHGLLLKGI